MNRCCLLLLVAVCLAPAAPALELDCIRSAESGFHEAGLVAAAGVVDLAVDGDLAVGATLDQVQIIDLAVPDEPLVVATWAPPAGEVAAVALALPWAVVGDAEGAIHVLDLSDPAAPVAMPPSAPLLLPIVDLAAAGDHVAVAAGDATVAHLVLQPDAAPVLAWSVTVPDAVAGVVLGADHAHVACQFGGLQVLALSDGHAVAALPSPGTAAWHGLALVGDQLQLSESYLIWLDDGPGQIPDTRFRLRGVDVTDPSAPVLGGTVDWATADAPLRLAAAGPYGVAWDGRNLAAVAPPTATPDAVLGMLARAQQVHAVAGTAGLAGVASDDGFRFYRVAAPENPAPRATFREDAVASASHRYAARYQWLLDGSNHHWGFGANQGWARSLVVNDLTDDGQVLVLYESSDVDYLAVPEPLTATGGTGPGNERVYYRLDDDGIWMSPLETNASRALLPATGLFAASGGWAFVADQDTLRRVNCWDVSAPYVSGVYPLVGEPTVIHSPFGSSVILGYEDGLVEVYRFSGSSMELTTYQIDGTAHSVAVYRELILVGTDTGLQAIHAFIIGDIGKDLGDTWPVIDCEYPVTSLVADRGHVYLAQQDRGLRLLYLTVDTATDLGWGGPALDRVALAQADGFQPALVTMEANLAQVLSAHCGGTPAPEQPPLPRVPALTVAPNPFNPRTEVRFTLARTQALSLDLYDLAGRHVRALAQGVLEAGPRTVVWDGCDTDGRACGSGVYLARLRAEDGTARAKLTLVR
jgi:hypothetical protein